MSWELSESLGRPLKLRLQRGEVGRAAEGCLGLWRERVTQNLQQELS